MLSKDKKAFLEVSQKYFFTILLTCFVIILAGIGASGYLWHQKSELENHNNISATEASSAQAKVIELSSQLQDSSDNYNKLSKAVLDEHSNEVSTETISECGYEDAFPSWNAAPSEAQKKYASCIGGVEDNFIKDYILRNQ